MSVLSLQAQWIDLQYDADSSFYTLDSIDYKFPKKGVDSLIMALEIQAVISKLREDSYLAANLDAMKMKNDSTMEAKVFIGNKLFYGKLNWNGTDEEYLKDPRIRNIKLDKKGVSAKDINFVIETIREQLDNNGYPLSKIYFENQFVRNDSLYADIVIEKGALIRISSIEIKPDSIISPTFIRRFLDLNKDDEFNLEKVLDIPNQINTLPYLQMSDAPEVKIFGDKTVIDVPIKKRNASRFDFLIGVLPNVENPDRFTISGEITADLKNKLKRGEELYFYFRQLRPEAQRMDLRIKYPYLLGLPFGIHSSFSLYRNGTESRDLNAEGGLEYRTSAFANHIFYTSFQSSRLIEIDTAAIINSGRLPSSLDVSLNNIAYKFQYDKRDYRLNPRKGLALNAELIAGIKSIIPNLSLIHISEPTRPY